MKTCIMVIKHHTKPTNKILDIPLKNQIFQKDIMLYTSSDIFCQKLEVYTFNSDLFFFQSI